MDNNLYEVIKFYSTKSHKELSSLLLDKSKDELISLLNSLLTIYINDKNSSLLREYITVSMAGYIPTSTKIGFNGFKQSTQLGGKMIACEAKPQNINTEDNKKRKSPKKLKGGGNFTDFTIKRLTKYKKEKLNMLVSGFVDGELIYILEFPFSCFSFIKKLKEQLQKRFPRGDKAGEFLRSAGFTFENYKRCQKLKVIYLKKETLEKHKKNLTKNFYEFLSKKLKNESKK